MSSFQRHQQIVRLLAESGVVSVADLVKRLECSVATIRRDLSDLEKEGRLVRTHGGGMLPAHLAVEPAFSDKQVLSRDQKRSIGQRVVRDVPEGSTVYVDSGTTCLEAGTALLERGKNRIFTNSIPLLVAGCRSPGQVMAIGGELRKISQALVGGLGAPWMQHLRFDVALLGASAVTSDGEVMTTELQEAEIKSLALTRSEKRFLLVDADKFNAKAAVVYASLNQFTTGYTDKRFSADGASAFSRQHGLRFNRC